MRGSTFDHLMGIVTGALADLEARLLAQLDEPLTRIANQGAEMTATTAQILTDLDNIAATLAAEPAPLPAGTVAVATADLDTIAAKLADIMAKLKAPAPPAPPLAGPPSASPQGPPNSDPSVKSTPGLLG